VIVVVQFPGTTCDRETVAALEALRPGQVLRQWHGDEALPAETKLVVLPGGFSFGDYLRAGALAARSRVMEALRDHAAIGCQGRGGWVLGICNGFQILAESGLLPGALQRNHGLDCVCDTVGLVVQGGPQAMVEALPLDTPLRLPIAHRDGCYVADEPTLQQLAAERRILLTYSDAGAAQGGNPNGSDRNIAGICSANRRVLGLMPHPERAFGDWHLNQDGKRWLQALLAAIDADSEIHRPQDDSARHLRA
jgi:phosphoribosylformylglycinamidine synthase